MAVPPTFPAPHPDKAALRAELRARRATFVASLGPEVAQAGAWAAARLLLPHVPPTALVAIYLPFSDEIDPEPFAGILHARGQKLALPALHDATTMDFRGWSPGDPLEHGPFRLRQPPASAKAVAPDLILMPLVGFDRTGGRIGQGKSHYDRALVRYPGAHRIGFAWSVQEVHGHPVPHDPWDIPLHGVVTEEAFIPMPTPA